LFLYSVEIFYLLKVDWGRAAESNKGCARTITQEKYHMKVQPFNPLMHNHERHLKIKLTFKNPTTGLKGNKNL
jgi:hypothetical protein